MGRKEAPLSLRTILKRYPPQEETFESKNGNIVSQVSRREDGKILYVVPETTKLRPSDSQ